MNKKFFTAVILLHVLFFTVHVFSQAGQNWKWVHPSPQGSDLNWVKAFDANNWVAAGNCGTFMKTSNAGATWSFNVNAGGTLQGFGSGKHLYGGYFFDQNTGFVCGQNGWIARTTNGGTSWDSVASGTTSHLYGTFFLNSSTGFIAGGDRVGPSGLVGVVLKTTNAGISWQVFPHGAPDNTSEIFALDANHIYIALDHVILSGGFFRALQITTNAGVNWVSSPTGPDALFDVLFLNPDTGFVCGQTATLKRTFNGGISWSSVTPGSGATNFFKLIMPVPGTIYVVGSDFTYRTTNLGNNWVQIDPTRAEQTIIAEWYNMDITGSNIIAVSRCGYVNRSTNSGTNWLSTVNVTGKTAIFDVQSLAGTQNVWACGIPGNFDLDRMLYSSNGGANWVSQPMDPAFNGLLSISMLNASTGYVCGTGGEIRKTTNGGTNWNLLTTTVPVDQYLYKVDFIDVNTGWVFANSTNSGGNIWKTTNGGTNWSLQNSGLVGTQQVMYSADMVDASTGWFVNEAPGKPYKTTNGGTNWVQQSLNTGFAGRLNCVKMLNANTGYICGGNNEYPTPGALFKTTDGGATPWQNVTVPFSNIPYTTMDWTDANNGIIAAGTGLSAKTSNGGTSWTIYNTWLQGVQNLDMLNADTAYCVNGVQGLPGAPLAIMKYTASLTNVTSWEGTVPKDYMLMQNYPNPFNPVTTIKFALPKAGVVSLVVYDITGRVVKNILNNTPLGAGTVTHNFEGSELSSGVYFYSLTVDNNIIDTKKMLLVK
jgi:photosystem II stability/assembly factor-like uncharacterized protein